MDVDSPKTSDTDNGLDIGSLLVEARNNANLTSQDLADALKLNLDIIIKLETNVFKQELPVAFIRGYVKSYATKVGLETQPILVAFDTITGAPAPSLKRVESISTFGNKKGDFNSNSSLFKFISILIVLLFVTFASWQIWNRFLAPLYAEEGVVGQGAENDSIDLSLDADDSNTNSTSEGESGIASIEVKPQTETKVNGDLGSNDLNGVNNRNKVSPEPAVSSFQETVSQGTTSQDTSSAKGDENTSMPVQKPVQPNSFVDYQFSDVILDFSADCWVRITDATGEVLAEGVKRDGKHMPLKGVAPIKVVLGDPSAVSMSFDNQIFDLSGYLAGRRVQIILE